jgi:ribosomal protein S18 acetylase RimI-like enzyme
MKIREFQVSDTDDTILLWHNCGLTRPWNDPQLDINRKLAVDPDLFLVGTEGGKLVASVMGGYDGHRGWIYYLAVDPERQGCGCGQSLMQAIEHKLLQRGCPKINLQIRADNQAVIDFYSSLGFSEEKNMSMGKRLIPD